MNIKAGGEARASPFDLQNPDQAVGHSQNRAPGVVPGAAIHGARATNCGLHIRTIAAGAIGNGLEFYDFGVYGIFAVYIARVFYPEHSPFISLMLSVATFGVGFLARPLGAIVIGAYADRAGRKAALMLTVLLMGVGSATLGLLPGYHEIGIAAPLILVAARLVQGFSAGGESGSSVAMMMEASPQRGRGMAVAWQLSSQSIALLAAGLVGFVLTQTMPQAELRSWGWRIPFLIGVSIVPVGLYIRYKIDETLDLSASHAKSTAVLLEISARYKYPIILSILLLAGGSINQYFFAYMTTFALSALKLPAGVAMAAPVIIGATGASFGLLGGWIVDRHGRFYVNVIPRLLLIFGAYPLFAFVVSSHSIAAFLCITALLEALHLTCLCAAGVVMAECFPRNVRASAYSIGYAFGVTLFGGSAQLVFTWLIHATGNAASPIVYVILGNAVTLIAVLLMLAWQKHNKTNQPASA